MKGRKVTTEADRAADGRTAERDGEEVRGRQKKWRER